MSSNDLKTLEAEIERLKCELEHEASLRKNACNAYEYLMQQFKQLQRAQFGTRSEKYEYLSHSQQSLFDDNQPDLEENHSTNDESNVVDIAAYKRRKTKSSKELIKRIVVIPVENKMCGCGREKKVMRYEVREYYHHVPAIFEKIEQRREVVACTTGCAGSIETAKKPDHVPPKI